MDRTIDGRFIEKRVKLPITKVKLLLNDIKKTNKFKWAEFADLLGISNYTLRYNYRVKGNTIPLSVFNKIINLTKRHDYKKIINNLQIFDEFWGQKSLKNKNYKKIELPEINNLFAEFYGAMLGDGCVYYNLSGICISGDSRLDNYYLENYIPKQIYTLFKIKPKIYYSNQSNSIRCVIYSKKLSEFLIKKDFPRGKKLCGDLKIPYKFFNNQGLLKACIRGLMDTDGSISRHPHSKIMLNISIYSKTLLESCLAAFNKIGIKLGSYNKGINIYGDQKVTDYFRRIGSSNPKNILKFICFKNNTIVPTSKDIEMFLRRKNFSYMKLPYYGLVV